MSISVIPRGSRHNAVSTQVPDSSGSQTPAPDHRPQGVGRPIPRLVFSGAALSSPGPRPDNQDSGLAGPGLLAVTDGVGGNVGGAAASALVITSLAEQAPRTWDEDPDRRLRRAVTVANRRVGAVCNEVPMLDGMATTLTAVALSGTGRVVVAHIGDSRAYLMRGRQLVALTRDQSVVQAMLDAGTISAQQARQHPWRSVLLAALHGREDDVADVEVSTLRVLPGDRLLLCTDGLWCATSDEEIRQALAGEDDVHTSAARLLHSAQKAAVTDNITVLVADVTTATTAAGPTAVVGAGALPDDHWQRIPRVR